MAQASFYFDYPNRLSLTEQILHALEEMPEDLREVFVLSHYEGKPREVIAGDLRISETELDELISEANQVFFRFLRNP